MKPQELTALVLAVIIASIGVYDVWALYAKGPPATVSAVINAAAKEWPLIPFCAGLLAAHLFRM
jgi:hypothetical protein